MTKDCDMEDRRMKYMNQRKDLELTQILEQFETFERVYPYFVNMLQDQTTLEPKQDGLLKTIMKKEE